MIVVLAGTNGAGKSSIGGAARRAAGGDWYDPDRFMRQLLAANSGLDASTANGLAWTRGMELLDRAVREGADFAFETTLGGRTVTAKLLEALRRGVRVRLWYVALDSPERHLERVRGRHARGGHDIPEATIRARYVASPKNLARLLLAGAEARLFDNSVDVAPGEPAQLVELLRVSAGGVELVRPPDELPDWARIPVAAALKRYRPGARSEDV